MQTKIFDLNTPHYQNLLQDFVHDIYHHSGYVLAEANRVSAKAEAISISDGSKSFLLPYLLRQCPENICKPVLDKPIYDVVSPYGYPGILLNDNAQIDPSFLPQAIEALITAFQSHQICSAFIRLHPILNAEIQKTLINSGVVANGTTVSIDLTLSDDEQRRQIKPSRRTRINQCRRRGFRATLSPFSEVHITVFMHVYQDTMNRLNASKSYYFDRAYYESLVQLVPHIFICLIEFEGMPICGGLFTECCGIVQYHLSGTKKEFLNLTPNTLMLEEVRQWATARDNKVFHLGGGLGSQRDSLFEFKASFSNQYHDFSTLRLVTDANIYKNLVNMRAKQLNVDSDILLNANFFPAYRTQQI
jgi:Acetyltransferase (GNAT) domain